MSMNKKKIMLFSFTLLLFFGFSLAVFAAPATTTVATEYVAENPCDEASIRKVLRLVGFLLFIAKMIVPLIIIGFGTFDLYKAVTDKDEKSLSKQFKQLGIRIAAGLFVFFVPSIVYAVFGLSEKIDVTSTSQFKTCAACIFEPTNSAKCFVDDLDA